MCGLAGINRLLVKLGIGGGKSKKIDQSHSISGSDQSIGKNIVASDMTNVSTTIQVEKSK